MRYRRIAAFALALAIMGTTFSCGETELSTADNVSSAETVVSGGSSNDSDAQGGGSNDQQNSGQQSDGNTSSDNGGSSDSGDTSTDNGGTSNGGGTSSDNGGSSDGGSASADNGGTSNGGDTSTDNGGSSNGGGTSSDNGGSSDGGGTSSDNGGSSNGGGTSSDNGSSSEEESYTAEISLSSSPTYTGSNVEVSGSVVKITAGGDYKLTGTLADGQILVDTKAEEKVKLILSGTNIYNSSGPAIFVYEAKECTVKVQAGTKNELSDGGSNKNYDAVIYSNDTLVVKGGGELVISAGNAHGMESDDDIIIENGTVNITSKKSGMHANDGVTIKGGDITINGGTNGIKSEGPLTIEGGKTVISGGTKEEKSSIWVAQGKAFTYKGGYVYAAGNMVSAPTQSTNPCAAVGCGSVSANTNVKVYVNGSEAISFSPSNNFSCILVLSPDMTDGGSFGLDIGGSRSDFTLSSGNNVLNT